MDDVRAVMDAVGLERAVLMGVSEGGQMNMLFAATYPERVTALVLYATSARMTRTADYPYGPLPEVIDQILEQRLVEQSWGTGASSDLIFPSLAGDPEARRVAARMEQYSASPAGAAELARLNSAIDVRHVLAAIRVPTIVAHHIDDPFIEVGHGRYLAEHIPGARYVEVPGTDHGASEMGTRILSTTSRSS